MSTEVAKRKVTAMQRAIRCAELGARTRTIRHVTGLQSFEIRQLLQNDRGAVHGCNPKSREWYHAANVLKRADASMVVVRCAAAIKHGFEPADALLYAYGHYKNTCMAGPRICFDRAFDLTAQTFGIWILCTPAMSLVTCRHCGSRYLSSLTNVPGSEADCPFCALVRRYPHDPRIRQRFPYRPMPDYSVLARLLGPN